MAWIARHADLVVAGVTTEPVSADRDDDAFLACANAGGADVIVSGDRHLQDFTGWCGISVLSPRRFLDEVLGSSSAAG
jgi:predicted nucleic acid-binding protein